MKEISTKVMDEFEKTALDGLNAMREAMRHKGNDRRYFEQGRIGAAAVNGFVRLRASESNRMQVKLMTKRIDELASQGMLGRSNPKALTDGKS